jgi:hypothetical protein
MSEGYLIVNGTVENSIEINLLITSIKKIDSNRPVSVIVNSTDAKFIEADSVIFLDETNPTLCYFKSMLMSPYTKTIGLLPDQLLTYFDLGIWENLRSLDPIVLPKHRYLFNNEIVNPVMYSTASIEFKNFGVSSIPNAIFFNKDKGCDYILGLASVLCSSYDQDNYINFFADKEHEMPPFPKYIWPSWVLSLLQSITEKKISTFDFMHCVDLSKQENNYINNNWTKRWSEFLTYWVNDEGTLKIENFVQHGLVKYESKGWLTDEILENFKNK